MHLFSIIFAVVFFSSFVFFFAFLFHVALPRAFLEHSTWASDAGVVVVVVVLLLLRCRSNRPFSKMSSALEAVKVALLASSSRVSRPSSRGLSGEEPPPPLRRAPPSDVDEKDIVDIAPPNAFVSETTNGFQFVKDDDASNDDAHHIETFFLEPPPPVDDRSPPPRQKKDVVVEN